MDYCICWNYSFQFPCKNFWHEKLCRSWPRSCSISAASTFVWLWTRLSFLPVVEKYILRSIIWAVKSKGALQDVGNTKNIGCLQKSAAFDFDFLLCALLQYWCANVKNEEWPFQKGNFERYKFFVLIKQNIFSQVSIDSSTWPSETYLEISISILIWFLNNKN